MAVEKKWIDRGKMEIESPRLTVGLDKGAKRNKNLE